MTDDHPPEWPQHETPSEPSPQGSSRLEEADEPPMTERPAQIQDIIIACEFALAVYFGFVTVSVVVGGHQKVGGPGAADRATARQLTVGWPDIKEKTMAGEEQPQRQQLPPLDVDRMNQLYVMATCGPPAPSDLTPDEQQWWAYLTKEVEGGTGMPWPMNE